MLCRTKHQTPPIVLQRWGRPRPGPDRHRAHIVLYRGPKLETGGPDRLQTQKVAGSPSTSAWARPLSIGPVVSHAGRKQTGHDGRFRLRLGPRS
ncbi:hypothetical protein VTK26DRAFT_5654 [Humicola hyalothermophila]